LPLAMTQVPVWCDSHFVIESRGMLDLTQRPRRSGSEVVHETGSFVLFRRHLLRNARSGAIPAIEAPNPSDAGYDPAAADPGVGPDA
jgi:hypothetical protein